jgi:hypothetical protein
LALPLLAAILTLWLLIPVPGRHSIGFALAAGVFGFSLAALVAMTSSGVHSISVVTLMSMLGALLLPTLALVLAISDVPPLDSAMAHVSWVYWGRIRPLRAAVVRRAAPLVGSSSRTGLIAHSPSKGCTTRSIVLKP